MIETAAHKHSLKWLGSAGDTLGDVDPRTPVALLAAASDVTLVIDAAGTIRDVVFASEELEKDAYRAWVGRQWIDTVTVESKPKIKELLAEAAPRAGSRWRQVNHPAEEGPDVPVRYCVIRWGEDGRVVAIGRDLRAMAQLQRRLAEAQQAMEREYARIREGEKRYRLLFQLASEAVILVDAASGRATEANAAAGALLGRDVKKIVGRNFEDLFSETSRQAIGSFTAALRVTARVDRVHAKLGADKGAVLLSGAMFRQDSLSHFIMVLSPLAADPAGAVKEARTLAEVVAKIPDAFVVTDMERRVISANAAFLDLVEITSEASVKGQPLERWVGRPGVDMEVLAGNLARHGLVRHFATIVRGDYGTTEEVEIAAASVASGAEPCLGFTLRSTGWRTGSARASAGPALPKTAEQFTDLVGRVPLKNLVRETTDMIERLCIEAALGLTKDNRASAADMLGLSRQGLYAKLRRYGLGDLEPGLDEQH